MAEAFLVIPAKEWDELLEQLSFMSPDRVQLLLPGGEIVLSPTRATSLDSSERVHASMIQLNFTHLTLTSCVMPRSCWCGRGVA